jgi:hypothetical protein
VPNPDEKEPKLDELSLAIERQLGTTFAVRVTGVFSRTFNVYKIANNLRPAGVYNIPITNPDPGPDARLGTSDDPGTSVTYFDYPAQYRGLAFEQGTLINVPEARKIFKSFEVALAQKLAHNFQFMMAYSGTKRDWPFPGAYPNVGSPSVIPLDNPNADYLAADTTYEWSVKGSGAYFFPKQIMASAQYELRSGEPYARTVLFSGGRQIPSITLPVERLGTRRLPDIALLSLRIQKSIRFLKQGVTLRANLYNALNTNVVTALTAQSGANFERPTAIMPPRIWELSASYSF